MPPLALLVWLGAYLIGALPFGYLVARWRGVDIFKAGSGNIGATNVGRVLGKRLGILVFVLDFAKGALPVAAALALRNELPTSEFSARGWLEVGAGLAAFLGHLFPVYLGFRGGKGVATGAGVVLVLLPGPTLAALLAWITVVAATSYVSLGSLAAVVVLCALHIFGQRSVDVTEPRTLFCLFAAVLVFVKHRANIARLRAGTENKIRWGDAMSRSLHVLALGLWFGSAVFFAVVATPTLFASFKDLGKNDERPAWFPLPFSFAHKDSEIDGPVEQGSRAFGYAVAPLFPKHFLLQGVCGFIALWTALGWSRAQPGAGVHRWRVNLLIAALATVLAGLPLERKVSDLRDPRNRAIDAYLSSDSKTRADKLPDMREARAEFGRWHFYSLALNFVTLLLVTGAMALAGHLPAAPVVVRDEEQPS